MNRFIISKAANGYFAEKQGVKPPLRVVGKNPKEVVYAIMDDLSRFMDERLTLAPNSEIELDNDIKSTSDGNESNKKN